MSAKKMLVLLAGLALFVQPVSAGQWVETTQTDFADGVFNVNVIADHSGILKVHQDAIYDLNEDGNPDIIISNMQDTLWGDDFDVPSYIYWGTDSGYTISQRTAIYTHGATGNSVADLNNDGYWDIVFSSYDRSGSQYGRIYWGSDQGYTETNTDSLPVQGSHYNYVADLDGDHYLDIIFTNYGKNYAHDVPSYIYWGGASGYSSSNRTELQTHGATGCSVSDLNRDGYLDIVISNTISGIDDVCINSYIFWGDSSGYSDNRKDSLPTKAGYGNAVCDLNKDGYLDIVFSNHRDGSDPNYQYECNSVIYWGDSTGHFSSTRITELPTLGAISVSIGDLNLDQWPDVVFANWRSGTTWNVSSYIYWGSSSGYQATNRTELPVFACTGVMIGKVANNGTPGGGQYPDIVFTGQTNSFIYFNGTDGFSTSNRTSLSCSYGSMSTKNAGNLCDRSKIETYFSSVFGNEVDTKEWGSCSWNEQMPAGASAQVSLRTGNTADPDDGSWSSWSQVAKSGLPGKASPSKYIQYQYTATANELYQGPVLNDITIDYIVPAGINGEPKEALKTDFSVQIQGSQARIKYTIAEPGKVSIKAYNLLGQQVGVLEEGTKAAGSYQFNWGKQGTLSNGIYIVRAQLGREWFTKRLVLVE
ncbi:VCBS repeat-containing protein [candidate division TA06 bacterium]|nr:VCBS repeat-containing protein [candidate division TA06 bacterium]